jgi:uncharacterized protein
MRIIDFHTHAFPDSLARRAMESLTAGVPDWPAYHDGTIAGLLGSMDGAGIHSAVIANIATKPSQERPILEWSKSIQSERIIPFISLHPDGEGHDALLDEAVEAGIRGVKFHCLYQGFVVNEDKALRMYERIAARDLVILFHAGRDPVWPTSDDASPARLLHIHRRFPPLRMVAAHSGGWRMWEEVAEHLAGEDIWLELSFAGDVPDETWETIRERHSPERYVFGSDCPWTDQVTTLAQVRRRLGDEASIEQVLALNPADLLGLSD